MTIRIPVSTIQNLWHNAQRVDRSDLNTEQDHNAQSVAAVVNNHFGSGVLPSSPTQAILFDSDDLSQSQASTLAAGNFDGTGLQPAIQPSDTNLGNQLEVALTGTSAFGRLSTKVLIVGLDFQGQPQYDRFIFYKSEKQLTRKHYAKILGIFFNDFKGNNNCSRDLGGRIVISEAASYQLSRDAIMISQDVEPNLFFRDFKVADVAQTLYNTLQTGIGSEYTVDSLGINTTVKLNRTLSAGDVDSKIGQKFLASTNNIQKITLLLGSSRDYSAAVANRYDWSGQLVISVYELQTTVSCPTDITPGLAIDFDPNPYPIAQLSFSQADLRSLGYVLTDVLQPVDFIFSDTQLGSTTNSKIVSGNYYAITINRAGAAGTGTVFAGVGNDRTDYSRLTLFGSGIWVDVEEEDMWFQVWSDAAKVADGQAYDAGNGIEIEKTIINSDGAEIDYALDDQSFSDSGENVLNIAVIQAIQTPSQQEQDERTGSPVYARQQFEPEFSFVTPSGLTTLQATTEPLIIGCAEDTNPKSNPLIEQTQLLPGLAKDDIFTIINPDPDLLSNNLLGSKLIPNTLAVSKEYRIFKVTVCVDGYGDVNGDGGIDALDIARVAQLVGESLELTSTQTKILNGEISTLEMLRADVDGDGYITSNDVDLITEYVARSINAFPIGSTFQHMDIQVQESIGRYDGYFDCDGYIRLDGYAAHNLIDPAALSTEEQVYDGYIITPSIDGSDPLFTAVPFAGNTYQVVAQSFWQDYLLAFSSDSRQVPAAFTYSDSVAIPDCTQASLLSCTAQYDISPTCEPGRTDFMLPDNLIMRRGQILNPDGTHYKIDYEVGQIVLELPAIALDESSLDVFHKLVVDAGDGFTSAGFPAMRFADCTTVQSDALDKNQLRFDVAIQAFYPNLDGYDDDDGYEVNVDNLIGVYMDHTNGILTLTIKDLAVDPVYMTLVTKIQITVHIKKAGWNNAVLIVDSDQIAGLLS